MTALSLEDLRSSRLVLLAAALLIPGVVLAADRHSKVPKARQFNPNDKTVELFSAIEDGQLEVKLIPKDSTQCRVTIENKTDKPLNVKLPDAFAGVPVLAQQLAGGGNRGGRNLGTSGNQGFGGGFGGMGGMGGMMWNIPPEKVGKFKLPTVCLEHGKKEPRPGVPYEIKPIETFTDKVAVHELCRMLASGELNQRAAQAAAWHLNNNMSWEELAAKRYRHANGTRSPYYAPQELQAAIEIAATAVNLAEQREKDRGQTHSASLN